MPPVLKTRRSPDIPSPGCPMWLAVVINLTASRGRWDAMKDSHVSLVAVTVAELDSRVSPSVSEFARTASSMDCLVRASCSRLARWTSVNESRVSPVAVRVSLNAPMERSPGGSAPKIAIPRRQPAPACTSPRPRYRRRSSSRIQSPYRRYWRLSHFFGSYSLYLPAIRLDAACHSWGVPCPRWIQRWCWVEIFVAR